jgi:D-xylose transport system permease protein
VVELKEIRNAFGGVKAVVGVSIYLYPGEVVAVLGHYGAGKSTLMKMLAGDYRVDSGETRVGGEVVHIRTPSEAQALGIETIYQGWLTAMLGVPSFVVTLGGLMSFRGAAFLVADGKTQPVNDEFFQRLGGGYDGGIGTTATWAIAAFVALVLFGRMLQKRRARAHHEMPNEPLWMEVLLTAVPAAVVFVFAAVMNNYQIASKDAPQGLPIPVLIWAVVAIVLSFIVHRTRFGRYVFAMGGNPDAAALVGIPVKRVTLMLFALLAVLVTVAAIVSIARLNAGTNSLGTGMELYVIAAAVIGGTALAGGTGSIFGSVLGALIMQSLDSGMLLLDVPIGKRMVIIGQVLIVAVVFDVLYRRKFGEN